MEDKIKKLEEWVRKYYKPYRCSWTSERSYGNYDDCFDDGRLVQESWDAYEIGCILGMDLEAPQTIEEDE